MSTIAPPTRHRDLTFSLASCQYPSGLLDRDLAERVLLKLTGSERAAFPRFLIRVGDQIYVDATAGLFDPARQDEALDSAYVAANSSIGGGATQRRFAIVEQQMSGIYTMLDDHEISDNWEPEPGSPENAALLQEACVAYVAKCRSDPLRPGYVSTYKLGTALWYTETDSVSGHRFFFADSRTMRTPRTSLDYDKASILGEEQWQAIRAWLREGSDDHVSFVSTPAILLPRRLATSTQADAALHSDAWDGYPFSLHAMLACVCDEATGNVVFLSGDEHLSCVAKFHVKRVDSCDEPVVAYSIHSSALYAPYPFANSRPEVFARKERFKFLHPDGEGRPVWYECSVETCFPEVRDSVAIISLSEVVDGYCLEVEFLAGDVEPGVPSPRWSALLSR